ncbi:MAG: hypothetical protein M0Q44_17760 [Methylobacter sp.]|jgi:hypothetical protein|nr:hypothetical protein [Methylobacter sp.]
MDQLPRRQILDVDGPTIGSVQLPGNGRCLAGWAYLGVFVGLGLPVLFITAKPTRLKPV